MISGIVGYSTGYGIILTCFDIYFADFFRSAKDRACMGSACALGIGRFLDGHRRC